MKTGKNRPTEKKAAGIRVLTAVCGLCLFAAPFSSAAYAGGGGEWQRTEDGRYWQYVYGPNRKAEDEWIEVDGKEYYLDKKGRMKTGWVTNEEDENRYYMGKDGAKCRNMFLPDGTFVGPDGLVLESFEAWRKAVRKELERLRKTDKDGVFFLKDLNGDGYRDLAVLNRREAPDRLYLAALWEEETETLQTVSESGPEEEGRSILSVNGDSTWLILWKEETLERDYFELGTYGDYFEHRHRFTTERNDWGDLVYVADGEQTEKEEWEKLLKEADLMAGFTDGVFPFAGKEETAWALDRQSIETALTQIPAPEELHLWQP